MADYDEIAEAKIQKTLERKARLLAIRKKQRWRSDFGMVASLGGVIIVPILLGIWIGGKLEELYPVEFSWRLTMLFLGFWWGGINAYFWIKIENDKIKKNEQFIETEIKKDR